ncbi:MAG: primosomal protein N', partial [Candidatus Cloacimonadota bacterium]|nr:primosomal protein N' [Candidatus Cloacimonadota bacterium]
MIAKGLDFPNVTLVGVISADIGLNMPDFRASEKTFQILTQVAGRAGRGEKEGEVFIQTYNPEHYAIVSAREQNFEKFAEEELILRKQLYYSPFTRMARIIFRFQNLKYLQNEMRKNKILIEKIGLRLSKENIIIMGPNPAPFAKLQNYYRYHIIIKSKTISGIPKAINMIMNHIKISKRIKVLKDIDPSNLF